MQFTISKSELQTALSIAGKCVNQNNINPAWGMIGFEINNTSLLVSAFDGERYIAYQTSCDSKDAATFFIAATELRVINDLADQPLIISILDTQIEVKHHNGKFKLPFETIAFTAIAHEPEHKFDINGDALSKSLFKVSFACAQPTEPRIYFQGVYVEVSDNVAQFTACDTNVLSTHPVVIEEPVECKFVLPKKSAELIASLPYEETIKVSVGDKNIMFKPNEQTTFISGLIAEKYIDYRVIFNKHYPNKVTVSRNELIGAVKRCNHFAQQYVTLVVGEQLSIISENSFLSKEAGEVLKADITGGEMVINFVGTWLLPALQKTSAELITLEISSNKLGMIIKDDASHGFGNCLMVMPVILQ